MQIQQAFCRLAIFFLSLLFICFSTPLIAQQPAAGVSLNTPKIWSFNKEKTPDQKPRYGSAVALEIARQAVLIAARDELGLRTLDVSLGEPAELPGFVPVTLGIDVIEFEGTRLDLAANGKTILEHEMEIPWHSIKQLKPMLEKHEAFSRQEAVQALREAGLNGQANRWRDSAAVPEDVQSLIDQMSLVPQFRAARALHKLIREDGESPERLWALSRVYANLSQECRWFIRCEYAVFQARSLLYAQRLRVKAPEHMLGHVAISYAWMMAGYTNPMEAHLKALEKTLDAAPQDEQPAWAGWARLMRACCMYDTDKLAAFIEAGGTFAQIAAFWNVFTNEFVDMDQLTFSSIKTATEVNPQSVRLLYAGYDAMGVSAGHMLTREVPKQFATITPRLLKAIRDAPGPVQDLLNGLDGAPMSLRELADLGWALEDLAGAGKDPGELTYGALGTLIGEANALHVLYRADFIRDTLAVDSNDYLDDALPCIKRHPYRLLIETFRFSKGSTEEGMQKLLKQFEPEMINGISLSVFVYHIPNDLRMANGWTENEWWQYANESCLSAGNELLYRMRWFKTENKRSVLQNARHMGSFDQHHPKRVALTLEYPGLPENRVKFFIEKYSHHLLVIDAMASRLESEGEFKAALDYAERAAESLPERKTVERLARIELAMGNETRWLKLMRSIMDLPDYGLDHAAINRVIACTYMNAGRYQEALPYAVASAGSGSFFGYECAMFVYAALGDYEQAEAYSKRIDRRYGEAQWNTMRWYLWSGQGDVNAALESYRQYFKQSYADQPSTFSISFGWILVQADQFDEALQLVLDREKTDSLTSRELLNGVCLAHSLAKDEVRDRLLNKLINYPAEDGKRLRFSLLGDMIKSLLDGKPFDAKALDAWHEQHDQLGEQGNLYIGWVLVSSGDHERGVPMLRRFATSPSLTGMFTLDARAILRYEGYENDSMRPTGGEWAHDWQQNEAD